jgi:hypothetical protein
MPVVVPSRIARVAILLMATIGMFEIQIGCGTPTSPQTTAAVISSVSILTTSTTAQTITIQGSGFQNGLALTVGSATSTIFEQIANVTPSAFQATLVIAGPGTYTFQATNPGGPVSAGFPVTLQFTCPSPVPVHDTFTSVQVMMVSYVAGTNTLTETPILEAQYGFTATFYSFANFFQAVLTQSMANGLRCEPSVASLDFEVAGTGTGGM